MLSTKTMPQLKALAKDMGLTGYSKLNKVDLLMVIELEIDRLHAEAIQINDTRAIVSLAQDGNYLKSDRHVKDFSERMISRSLGYVQQNGYVLAENEDVYPAKHFTARQMRRYNKKVKREAKRLASLPI